MVECTPWRHIQGGDIFTARLTYRSDIHMIETYIIYNVHRVEYTYGVYIRRSIYTVVYAHKRTYIWR